MGSNTAEACRDGVVASRVCRQMVNGALEWAGQERKSESVRVQPARTGAAEPQVVRLVFLDALRWGCAEDQENIGGWGGVECPEGRSGDTLSVG